MRRDKPADSFDNVARQDFNIKILWKNFFDWAMNGGDTIILLSLRLGGIEFSLVWD